MEKKLCAPGEFYKYVNITPRLPLLIKYGILHEHIVSSLNILAYIYQQ